MVEFLPQTIYYPRDTVEFKYTSGELRVVESRLLSFVNRHRQDILEVALDESEKPSDEQLLDSTRLFILSMGTIHPPSEMAELIREINKEVWYRGEEGQMDRSRVAEDWKEKYAIQWREARLFEAFYVLERNASQVIAILRK